MKVTPYKIKKGFRYLKHYGPKAFWNRLLDKMEPDQVPYGPWQKRHKASEEELERQRKQGKKFACQPLISVVVPCYQTPENYLLEMMDSASGSSVWYRTGIGCPGRDFERGQRQQAVAGCGRGLRASCYVLYSDVLHSSGGSHDDRASGDRLSGSIRVCILYADGGGTADWLPQLFFQNL